MISRSWPSEENSGVSLAAKEHVKILIELGYSISIIGSNPSVFSLDLPIRKYYVKSKGNGSLYSPVRLRSQDLNDILNIERPDLIILESWQTAITDSSIDIAFSLKIPILMISHGISIFPFLNSFIDIARSLSWALYFFNFKKKLAKLSAITTFSDFSDSARFLDRKLAGMIGVPIIPMINHPINFNPKLIDFNFRKKQILVVGYFSRIKNQLAAISAIQFLPEPFKLIFIGKKEGSYYQKCIQKIKCHKISHRVNFYDDTEINLSQTIQESLIVYMPSITEVMPITLIEAMASGTPFITSNIGAIKDLNAGILENNICNHAVIMNKLIEDRELWCKISKAGLVAYKSKYTRRHTSQLLDIAVTQTINYAYIKNET